MMMEEKKTDVQDNNDFCNKDEKNEKKQINFKV